MVDETEPVQVANYLTLMNRQPPRYLRLGTPGQAQAFDGFASFQRVQLPVEPAVTGTKYRGFVDTEPRRVASVTTNLTTPESVVVVGAQPFRERTVTTLTAHAGHPHTRQTRQRSGLPAG